jgi:hypothetical protein
MQEQKSLEALRDSKKSTNYTSVQHPASFGNPEIMIRQVPSIIEEQLNRESNLDKPVVTPPDMQRPHTRKR